MGWTVVVMIVLKMSEARLFVLSCTGSIVKLGEELDNVLGIKCPFSDLRQGRIQIGYNTTVTPTFAVLYGVS